MAPLSSKKTTPDTQPSKAKNTSKGITKDKDLESILGKIKPKVPPKDEQLDLDSIFAQIKQNRSVQPKAQETPVQISKEELEKLSGKPTKSKSIPHHSISLLTLTHLEKTGPTTEEGYPIYTAAQLNLTLEEGNTEDCPFDCSCCF